MWYCTPGAWLQYIPSWFIIVKLSRLYFSVSWALHTSFSCPQWWGLHWQSARRSSSSRIPLESQLPQTSPCTGCPESDSWECWLWDINLRAESWLGLYPWDQYLWILKQVKLNNWNAVNTKASADFTGNSGCYYPAWRQRGWVFTHLTLTSHQVQAVHREGEITLWRWLSWNSGNWGIS